MSPNILLLFLSIVISSEMELLARISIVHHADIL